MRRPSSRSLMRRKLLHDRQRALSLTAIFTCPAGIDSIDAVSLSPSSAHRSLVVWTTRPSVMALQSLEHSRNNPCDFTLTALDVARQKPRTRGTVLIRHTACRSQRTDWATGHHLNECREAGNLRGYGVVTP